MTTWRTRAVVAIFAAALTWALGPASSLAQLDEPTLDPAEVPKFVEPLPIPPVMPPHGRGGRKGNGTTQYRIAVRQFEQQILPSGYPATPVWGYGPANEPLVGEGHGPSQFFSPSFTVEVRRGERVRVRWINELVDWKRRYLPHLLPVDPTLHWANPPGPRDSYGTGLAYSGPVPVVTHVHGADVPSVSDGLPEAWWLPKAKDIPEGYLTRGSNYGSVLPAPEGVAVFEYPNDQRAATLWYHDHALGLTRLNVYAGLAGFWLLRDEVEDGLALPGPAPRLGDPPGTRYYEIPIAIQDRSFDADGSLFYPDSREFFDGLLGPYLPGGDIHPIWNPEFFGNAMMANGRTWPYLEVEPRRYRFRFLNGCNARFLILRPDHPDVTVHQIGADQGFLPNEAVSLDELLLGPAERADVIVDFSDVEPGTEVILLNLGPDEPFGGGVPGVDFEPADPETTGRVMSFKVVELQSVDDSADPESLVLPPVEPLQSELPDRDITLNERVSMYADAPIAALMGTPADGPLMWDDPVTEQIGYGDTETWRLVNLTVDAHPIHVHLVQFQVIERIPFAAEVYEEALEAWRAAGATGEPPDPMAYVLGPPVEPTPGEAGWKDTVIAYPGALTRIRATFGRIGRYVWHCHILEHEDNEMMRPFTVSAGEP